MVASFYDLPEPWIRSLRPLATRPERWLRLVQCPHCGQRWQLERNDCDFMPASADGRSTTKVPSLAIKVPADADWAQFDDRPARIAYLIQSRGGLGPERCLWRDCTNRALKGFAHCPEHVYDGVP